MDNKLFYRWTGQWPSKHLFCACIKQAFLLFLHQADTYMLAPNRHLLHTIYQAETYSVLAPRRHLYLRTYIPSRHILSAYTKQTHIECLHQADTCSVLAPSRHIYGVLTLSRQLLCAIDQADTYCVLYTKQALILPLQQPDVLWLQQAKTSSVLAASKHLLCAIDQADTYCVIVTSRHLLCDCNS